MKKRLFFACLLLPGLSALAQTGICFSVTAVSPSMGGSPNHILFSDLNGDGIADMVVANYNSNDLAVLFGSGNGSFAAPVYYPVGGEPSEAVAADFNGDGKPDLAVANKANDNISVLINTGTGAFAPAVNYNTSGYGPMGLVAGDVNGDGQIDLVSSNLNSDNISIFLGTGSGTFGAAASHPVGSSPFSLTIADFNGGGLDLAVSCMGSNNMYILTGANDGTFSTTSMLPAGNSPLGIKAADYNNDGFTDIAVLSSSPDQLNVFLSSAGSFSGSTGYPTVSKGISLSAADFNGDGNKDIAVSSISGSNVSIYTGSASGSFATAATYPTGGSPYAVTSGDLNGDGKPDIATSNYGSNNATVLLNSISSLTITTTANAVCSGTPVNLSASGAVTYTWSTGANTSAISVTPFFSTTYTVSGTNANGCTFQSTETITVYAVPTVDVTPSGLTICAGNTANFTVNGTATTYTWSTGSNAMAQSVSPTTTTVYTVTGTNANGCTNQASIMVTVNPSPIASASTNTPLCTGGNLNFTNTSTGASSYSWTGPNSFASTATNPSISNLTGAESGNYQLQAINAVGCTASTVIAVTVNTPPSLTLTASSSSLCAGSPVTLSGSGASSYTWMPGSGNGSSQLYHPVSNTTYTLTGASLSGCTDSQTISVSVTALTDISGVATASSTVVPGQVILYRYEPFLTKFDSVTVQPLSATGAYTFTSVPQGSYIVKAVPSANSLQVTYGSSSISWQNATVISHDCSGPSTQNINIQSFLVLGGGPGSLSGTITQTLGFGQRPASPYSPLAPGQPIGGIVVKGGKNPGGNMFAQTTTDANGTYTLSGLPTNASNEYYFILVDIPGLDTNGTYRRVINTGNLVYTGLDFTVDSSRINPIPNTVGLKHLDAIQTELRVFPNPARNTVSIRYDLPVKASVSMELTDVLGHTVKVIVAGKEQTPMLYDHTVDVSTLEAGLYFIKIVINDKERVTKLLITN